MGFATLPLNKHHQDPSFHIMYQCILTPIPGKKPFLNFADTAQYGLGPAPSHVRRQRTKMKRPQVSCTVEVRNQAVQLLNQQSNR